MNILALDIGSAQIKCAVIEAKWKRYDIVYHDVLPVADALEEMPASDELLSSGQIQALLEVQRRYTHNIDRLVLNIPLSLYSTRLMTFPFKDKKKIQAAINFQIEDEIPFNIEDCVITAHTFPPSPKQKESNVLAGIAPISTLKKYIETLQKAGMDPDALLVEEPAFASLYGMQKNNLPNQSIAIINFGHRKSSISIYRDGLPVMHRISMHGGFQITKAISKKYEVSMAEAEVAKLDKAFVATPGMQLSAEQQLFSNVIASALDPVLHDFDQALMAFSSRFNNQIDNIFLSGGTALLPGLLENLNLRWNRKVLPFHVLTKIPHVSIRPQKSTELILPTALALGLSQVRSEHRSSFNFRSGAVRKQQSSLNINWQEFIGPMKLALVVYVFAVISLSFQLLFLNRDLSALDIKQDQTIKSILAPPNSSAMALLKGNPKRLKQNVDKKVEELQAQVFDGSGPGNSVLDIIQNLSRTVGRTAVVEIKEFNLTGNQLTMKLESPSQANAEAALKMLGSVPSLSNPRPSPIESAGGLNGRKKFSISFQLSKKEGSI